MYLHLVLLKYDKLIFIVSVTTNSE